MQVLNEFAAVARRKFRMSWGEVTEALAAIRVLCPSPMAVGIETHELALSLAERYGYEIYDALISASALESKCDKLYTEDLQHGQTIVSGPGKENGLTIVNPFRGR